MLKSFSKQLLKLCHILRIKQVLHVQVKRVLERCVQRHQIIVNQFELEPHILPHMHGRLLQIVKLCYKARKSLIFKYYAFFIHYQLSLQNDRREDICILGQRVDEPLDIAIVELLLPYSRAVHVLLRLKCLRSVDIVLRASVMEHVGRDTFSQIDLFIPLIEKTVRVN